MKKLLIALAATVALGGPAVAAYQKEVRAQVIPPKKYDHPYPGRVTIRRQDSSSLPCRPNSMSTRLGCAYLEDLDKDGSYSSAEREVGKECYIYLADPDEIKDAGYTENALLRHEMAACNGWEGYRTLGTNWIWTDKDFQ